MVHKLVQLGANVIAVARTQKNLESLRDELDGKLTIVSVDLANWEETEKKLAPLCENVDFLVNNAGYAFCKPVGEMPKNEIDKIIDVNLKAPLNLIQLVVGGMKERKFGSIVNVSSVASLVAADGHVAYAASKAGLDLITKVSAKELGLYNIRVNSVNPTIVWTRMGQEQWGDPEKQAMMKKKIPMGRFVEVREVVDPIIFLLSNDSSMITGTTMPIDGGYSAS